MENPENNRPIDAMELAKIAKIAIGEDEAKAIERDLLGKLRYIDRIAGVDTEGVPPTLRIPDRGIDCREDVVKPCPSRDSMLQNAPDQWDGFVRVPTVVGEEAGA